MARFTIQSRKYGPQKFWCPNGGGNLRREQANKPGTLAPQCCEGGNFMGRTIWCSEEEMPSVARKWWRQRREFLNEMDAR